MFPENIELSVFKVSNKDTRMTLIDFVLVSLMLKTKQHVTQSHKTKH